MNELIERVQEQLDNNWAVDAEDIQALVSANHRASEYCLDLYFNCNREGVIASESIQIYNVLNPKSHQQPDSE